jgi:hypothetical protein
MPETPFAALDDALTAAAMAALSDVIVTPEGGAPFPAILEIAHTGFFDTVRGCDWRIRYSAGHKLSAKQIVHIEGSPGIDPAATCQIAAEPVPLAGGREHSAGLIVRADI